MNTTVITSKGAVTTEDLVQHMKSLHQFASYHYNGNWNETDLRRAHDADHQEPGNRFAVTGPFAVHIHRQAGELWAGDEDGAE